jgi:alanine dehydrogenase
MPGGVPRTSTYALNNVTLPHILTLANQGFRKALKSNSHLCNGLNVHDGQVTNAEVAADLGYNYVDPMSVLG